MLGTHVPVPSVHTDKASYSLKCHHSRDSAAGAGAGGLVSLAVYRALTAPWLPEPCCYGGSLRQTTFRLCKVTDVCDTLKT